MAEGLCSGRVVVVTGAGDGIGRALALAFAAQGAKVVVNDLGGSRDGTGTRPARPRRSSTRSRAAGGEAVANTDDISDLGRARERLIEQAVTTFGGLDVVVNNAGILRDRMIVKMTEADWDAVINVHLKGTFASTRHAAAYWRARSKAGDTPTRADHQHHVAVRPVRQCRAGQLRRGQGRHRHVHDHRRHGARALRRHGQRDRADRAHPHDRGRRVMANAQADAAGRNRDGPRDHLALGGVAGQPVVQAR